MGFIRKAADAARGAAVDASANPGKTSSFASVASQALADSGRSGAAAVVSAAGAAAVAWHAATAGNTGGEQVEYAGFTEEPKKRRWL